MITPAGIFGSTLSDNSSLPLKANIHCAAHVTEPVLKSVEDIKKKQ
jgi:hypothetical protein